MTGNDAKKTSDKGMRPRYNNDFFRQLTVERDAFMLAARLRQYGKDEYLYLDNDESRSIYYIAEGSIKTSRISEGGREVIFYIHKKGEIIGLLAAMHGNRRFVNAQALSPSGLYEISSADFKVLLEKYPGMAQRVIEMLVNRAVYFADKYVSAINDSAATRLVTSMAYMYYETLSDMKARNTGKSAALGINQEAVAAAAGITRQTANQILHCLDRDGHIDIRRNTIMFNNPSYFLDRIEM